VSTGWQICRRRIKCQKVNDNGWTQKDPQWIPKDNKSSLGLWSAQLIFWFVCIYILPISPYFSVAKSSHCVVLVKLVLQSLIQGWEPDLSQLTSPDDHHYYHPHKHPSIPSVTCANGECW
jgi:hypothetical protein